MVFLAMAVMLGMPEAGVCQRETLYPDYPRIHNGLVSITLHGGAGKYFGEFVGDPVGYAVGITPMYSLFPSLSVGFTGSFGEAVYERRQRRHFHDTYKLQFNTKESKLASTEYYSAGLAFLIKFYPAHYLDVNVLLGGGVMVFSPSDYAEHLTRYSPGKTSISAPDIMAGIGMEYSLTNRLALTFEAKNHLLLSDQFDAFDSEVLTVHLPGGDVNPPAPNYDFLLEITLGVKYYIDIPFFGHASYEHPLKHRDSDYDSISDFDELYTHGTDPKKRDSDNDGVNDYDEITKYHSNPTMADTDRDGIPDYNEIFLHGSNALMADSDGDSLSDSLEIALRINPINPDTDRDGLRDDVEVRSTGTDPRLRDTDGDGLSDLEELSTYHTDPLNPDTDGDGLQDAQEITLYKSNPLAVDTDGDGISDYDEVKKYATNPTEREDSVIRSTGSSSVRGSKTRR